MLAAHKVSVHFSENHANYIAAYRCVCKSARNVLFSPGHPDLDLTVSPQTSCASKEVQRQRRSSTNKNRNLIITGPSNCEKTFILDPLNTIFDTFTNPYSCKYAFVPVEKKELTLLNDLRWTPEMIPWSDFLNLLEGQTVHLAAPKTHFAQDIILSGDMPIFAMSIEMVQFVGKNNHVQDEKC